MINFEDTILQDTDKDLDMLKFMPDFYKLLYFKAKLKFLKKINEEIKKKHI